ncbi:MAG: GNAT family N-acetyltransferase [Deltaproteobacteria bacterium]|nr:GNAT family N-acetyltransferase [Deltaproteobacteria bacterium]
MNQLFKEDANRLENRLRIRSLRFGELDQKIVAAWASLEERALENNAYLSPRFMIPELRRLGSLKELEKTIFVFIERPSGKTTDLVGVGVFVRSSGTRKFPLPHLRAYLSIHAYLSGLLVDRDEAENVIRLFFRFFCGKDATWQGVEFAYRYAEGPQAELIAAIANEFNTPWHEHMQSRRAVFIPSEGGDGYIQANYSAHRIKELRRLRRRLEERGEVHWRALFGADADEESVERFLQIEHMGWKGDKGTSLRSRPSHEAFFKEMIRDFRQKGKLFLTELSLDDIAIASTTNLISGGTGFAFKIGYHPDYAEMSPGLLNELEFIRYAPALCGNLSYIDSGAEEGSFIDRLWTERRRLVSGIFATTSIAKGVLSGVNRVRKFKHRCETLLAPR